jgi:hypothetical protein
VTWEWVPGSGGEPVVTASTGGVDPTAATVAGPTAGACQAVPGEPAACAVALTNTSSAEMAVAQTGAMYARAVISGVEETAGVGVTVEPVVRAELKLECEPSTVVRGSTVVCTAKAEPEGENFTITEWTFSSELGLAVTRRDATTSREWTGTMAVSGTVSVTGQIGARSASTEARIEVSPRNWHGRQVASDIHELQNDHLPPLVTVDSELGDVHQTLVDRYDIVTIVIRSGPNEGAAFLSDLPFIHQARIHVNRQALAPRSRFSDRHPVSNLVPGGTCTVDYLDKTLPGLILAHEGLGSEVNSHTWLYRRSVEEADVGPAFESIVGLGEIPIGARGPASQILKSVHEQADLADDQADVVNKVRTTCRINYF